jgi:microcystin-dependent protein
MTGYTPEPGQGENYYLLTKGINNFGISNTQGATARHTHAIPEDGWNHTHGVTTGTESANHAHGITAQGGGAAHENMPPYYALTYIIKQ